MSSQHNRCYFHQGYSHAYVLNDDPKPYCSMCQATIDTKNSNTITGAHKPGKWCSQRNQCRKCCGIRNAVRTLRHFGGVCSPRVCPVCDWTKYDGHYSDQASDRLIKRIWRNIYLENLGKHTIF